MNDTQLFRNSRNAVAESIRQYTSINAAWPDAAISRHMKQYAPADRLGQKIIIQDIIIACIWFTDRVQLSHIEQRLMNYIQA